MIPQGRLRESGFSDEKKFPRELIDHEIELSLPSAMAHGVASVRVRVARGLVVPLQVSGSANGTVIRSDGAILHVGHQDPADAASALEAHFIRDIPYDLRVDVVHIMRRALQADPSLKGIWDEILQAWKIWFPAPESVGVFKQAGTFDRVDQAWQGMVHLMGQLMSQLDQHVPVPAHVKVRVVVQLEAEFRKGWCGEELLAGEAAAAAIIKAGWINYVKNFIFPKLQLVLGSPVFHPQSTFKLLYGVGGAPTIKLVVVPRPGVDASGLTAVGIELSQACRDIFPPPSGKAA